MPFGFTITFASPRTGATRYRARFHHRGLAAAAAEGSRQVALTVELLQVHWCCDEAVKAGTLGRVVVGCS